MLRRSQLGPLGTAAWDRGWQGRQQLRRPAVFVSSHGEQQLAGAVGEIRIERRRLVWVAVGVLPQSELRVIQDKHASLVRQHEAVSRAVEGSHALSRGSIIDSSFIMQPGETVVVGTSRLGGDKAIIALVTAAKKPSGTARELSALSCQL